MKRLLRTRSLLALAVFCLAGIRSPLGAEIDQNRTPYNLQSVRGVPLSQTAGTPLGSDGRAPNPATETATHNFPTPNQFQGFLSFGGVAAPLDPLMLDPSISYSSNAASILLPRGVDSGGRIAVVLRSAQVGSPFLSRQISFLFGSVIPVPETDPDGHLLPPNISKENYWLAEPYTTNNHANAGYYWSPNLRAVFAIQPGPIAITWKKTSPESSQPTGAENVDWVLQSGFYYRLFTDRYVVSGSAVKKPRKIYWTEGAFRQIGKAVAVPSARVGGVIVVYNTNFPERVPHEYAPPGQVPIVQSGQLEETRTLWYDRQRGEILAYNIEGRVFMELLGDAREDGLSRQHLGFEIVDVFKQPNPQDVTIELGERTTAYQDGRDDSDLFPDPVLQPGSPIFLYQQSIGGSDRPDYYAIRETQNLNDVLVHWLETGEVGLRWPSLFARYKLMWPSDPAKYSHYIRPLVQTETQAKETAVALPLNNSPVIAYQDPLDRPRAFLDGLNFFTVVDQQYPAHRTLLRLNSGPNVAFERIFSWLDVNLKSGSFAGTVAQNLSVWDPIQQRLSFSDLATSPRVMSDNVDVGDRIKPPLGELGAAGGEQYWAGHIQVDQGTSFDPKAYIDPFAAGFDVANKGSIIPVNAIPGKNQLVVYWFRRDNPNLGKGFKYIYWPSVIATYTVQWPDSPSEIILASNAGSGALDSLQSKGEIYYENDPNAIGYNPNEEHGLMLGGQAYALRDDLNITTPGPKYSSEPFLLLKYVDADQRPAMRVFKVLREKASAGILFDYLSEAGQKLQAPMPLPLLEKPVEGSGPSAINYDTEPTVADGDLPVNWNDLAQATGPYRQYKKFVLRDRKNDFWVYRGLHSGPPALQAGTYDQGTSTFGTPVNAVAIVGQDFSYFVHASRLEGSILMQPQSGSPLPFWLRINGLSLVGRPAASDVGTINLNLTLTAIDDNSTVNITLQVTVAASGNTVAQGPITIISPNSYAGTTVNYIGRPPYLAASPVHTNSFTMRFYYKTQEGFAWPDISNPPAVGAIVPYLRPKDNLGNFVGDPTAKSTAALDIVYRPYWPFAQSKLGKMRFGDSLTTPKLGLPAVRGQTSMKIVYQQSIAGDIVVARPAAILHDPTREKGNALKGLDRLPDGVRIDNFQGKQYFPALPPHLAKRIFFDPNRGNKGELVFRGQFNDDPVGEKYLFLNVLRGSDLAAVKGLCPVGDPNKIAWDSTIDGLSTKVETFRENPLVPGTFIPEPSLDANVGVGQLAEITDEDTAVDSYALSASGPGQGYITLIAGNGFAFTPAAEPVSMYIIKVVSPLYSGELKVVPSDNPLNEQLTMQHTADLAGRFSEYEYQWMIAPPVDGTPPPISVNMTGWTALASGTDVPRFTLGGAGVQALSDNYLVMRYRPINPSHPLNGTWSDWTVPQLAEGWIKRVLAGINPFNQRVNDLFNNRVNTDASIISQAGHRWEGDVALNLASINNFGLIEIYETVLKRGKSLSIDAGINYGPANDALLLAAGYLNDLYVMLGNEAWADAANPTIGIGTKDNTYGNIATALFAFKGQVPSLLDEELSLLRGRDDFLQPGVEVPPVYNRLFWNYTRGIDAGEVIYALNYNIHENADIGFDGIIDASDAQKMFPQGHGDAYGHYLTALKGYYALLLDTDFDWVPRTEAVLVLGKPVQVDYLDERKFASAAAAVARTGRQIFDLTWREEYKPGSVGWSHFSTTRQNQSRKIQSTRNWGVDHWAARTGQGAYINWVTGNAILPDLDSDPSHEGIQKIDRTTVPELAELATIGADLQTAMDSAEGALTPLGLSANSIPFDLNPLSVLSGQNTSHFEQIYDRAITALGNAVSSFDDAKNVTQLMRSEEDSLTDLQTQVSKQEAAYTAQLIELYGTPYPDDVGPGKTYVQGYNGPDLIHYTYVDVPEIKFPELWNHTEATEFKIDLQDLPKDWITNIYDTFNFVKKSDDSSYDPTNYITISVGANAYADKPSSWNGKRQYPGQIQQAISEHIMAQRALKNALYDNNGGKADLDKAIRMFEAQKITATTTTLNDTNSLALQKSMDDLQSTYDVLAKDLDTANSVADLIKDSALQDLPKSSIFGVAFGGDTMFPARIVIMTAYLASKIGMMAADAGSFRVLQGSLKDKRESIFNNALNNASLQLTDSFRQSVYQLFQQMETVQAALETIDTRLRQLDDAERKLRALTAQGDRIQAERETFRRRSAAVVQGFRTRDAAFRIFRNEKLERYKTLFDLAARYAFLAANAYDYETGLLNTAAGRDFVSRIIRSRALGIVRDGTPQFAGSDTGDPGLSSALAEMKADWDVLKGRLGIKNPDAYGTTLSLRTENFRILPSSEGDDRWHDILNQGRRDNLLDDSDVRRYCMQIDQNNGLPVPGIIVEFSTTIADGLNFFGKTLAPGDHAFSPASFATKVFGVGVSLEGYKGMDNPVANGSAISDSKASSPADPSLAFLDPDAMAANPYVYLIPVGVDSMRSPPLGDTSEIRTWNVADVAIPLPFNIGGSQFSTANLLQSSATLTEPPFAIRKHQPFRPVSSANVFGTLVVYWVGGEVERSQYTNTRLLGRSAWNSKWKLVIPGRTLLNDPKEGLDRFTRSVKDVKLYYSTYSYSGN